MSAPEEEQRFLTGRGNYVSDLLDDNTLHCWFVRSPIAHGVITGIDIGMAASSQGVVGVFTANDLDLPDLPANTGIGATNPQMKRPVLARDRVRFVGEAVAVVVARKPGIAEDAAGLVWVDYEELPVVLDASDSAGDGVLLFPDAGTNVVAAMSLEEGRTGDRDADVSITIDLDNQRLAPTSIEPLAMLARPGEDQMRVYCGHQAPHRLRDQLELLGPFEPGSIRVIAPDVGGAFGMKGMLFPEYFVIPRLAQILGAPVAWIATRRENMLVGTHGRGQHHSITLQGDSSGEIQRLHIDLLADAGAYPHNGSQIPLFTRLTSVGLYRIPEVEVNITTVVTNTAPVGSYRGAGRPEAAYAIERAIDEFGKAVGLDQFEIRRRNLIGADALPYQTATGALYDSGNYRLALDRAEEMLDPVSIDAERERRTRAGDRPIGVGIASFVERAGGAVDSGEYARVEIDFEARRVVVRTGSTDQGQGHEKVWRDLLQGVYGLDQIDVVSGDTGEVAEGVGTFASRSAQAGASAALRTGQSALDEARNRAAAKLEASPADIVYANGVFSVIGSPGSDVSLFDLAEDGPLLAEELYVPGAQTFPYGVYGVVVEVDMETGEVCPLRIVAVDDCGRVLDQAIVHGQLVGSMAQGLGQALFEGVRYSDDGQLLTTSLMDYLVPHAVDIPPIITDRLESPAPSNPLGAKGAGESGCIGLPPAMVNATLDALRPYGVSEIQMPLTSCRVWTALQDVGP